MSKHRTQRYDVVVIGGGAAGVAAALGAERQGAHTLLVERYGFLGGAAANANVLSYCGFYLAGPDHRLIVGGVGTRVLAELERLGFEASPIRAPSGNWIVMLDPEAVKVAMDRVVAESDIDCRLHCSLIGMNRSSARIEAVTLFDHIGPFDVEATAFVDASGDADLGQAAGVPTMAQAEPGRPRQVASFPVRFTGVPRDLTVERDALAALMPAFRNDIANAYVRQHGGHFIRLPGSHDLWWMGIDLVTGGLDSDDMGIAERNGRELAWRFLELLRARMPGFERAFIAATGPQAGIRDSRQLQTRYRLTDADVLSGRLRDDGIACGCWPAEVHAGPGGPKFRPVGGDGYYHVPLASLHAVDVDNLWLGGRVIGCDEMAYGSLRVMGTAFATGQAAGIAAAQCGNSAPDAVRVRAELLRQGAIL
jgi:hypothetical protein